MRGSIFRSENDIYFPPPPSENYIFSPSYDTLFFDSHHGLFALILPYFAIILLFYFPLLIFFPLSSSFFPLSSFLFPPFSFFVTFSPFFSSPFHIFSPKWHRLIPPPPSRGGGYFPINRPLDKCYELFFPVSLIFFLWFAPLILNSVDFM